MLVLYAIAINTCSHRLILDPFNRLMDSIAKVGEQSKEPLYGLERTDEFGKLARSVQGMKNRLDAYMLNCCLLWSRPSMQIRQRRISWPICRMKCVLP